jgi:hypothetical protein
MTTTPPPILHVPLCVSLVLCCVRLAPFEHTTQGQRPSALGEGGETTEEFQEREGRGGVRR